MIEMHEGAINTSNLDGFLRSQGHFASDLELLAMIRRMDADGDATITYEEFADFLRPISAIAPAPRYVYHEEP